MESADRHKPDDVNDQHGHEAVGGAQGSLVAFTVNNVAPTVSGGTITLNGGLDLVLTNPGAETTGLDGAAATLPKTSDLKLTHRVHFLSKLN